MGSFIIDGFDTNASPRNPRFNTNFINFGIEDEKTFFSVEFRIINILTNQPIKPTINLICQVRKRSDRIVEQECLRDARLNHYNIKKRGVAIKFFVEIDSLESIYIEEMILRAELPPERELAAEYRQQINSTSLASVAESAERATRYRSQRAIFRSQQ